MNMTLLRIVVYLLTMMMVLHPAVTAFHAGLVVRNSRWSSTSTSTSARSTSSLVIAHAQSITTSESDADDTVVKVKSERSLNANGLHNEERYVTTLRFLVAKETEIEFEHRWSDLLQSKHNTPSSLPSGLLYFHMGKRGMDFMGPPLSDDEFNYQSYAVWESKEAYNEATHAGLFNLDEITKMYDGAPANYEGIFALSVPTAISGVPTTATTIDDPSSQKQKRLPREAFVASNRFGIKPGFEQDFEELWAARDSSLAELPGFVNFQLLRRDGSSEDDGNPYLSYTTWDSPKAFNNWRDSDNFKRSHSNSGGGEKKESPYAKMPKVVTFKNFLVVSDEAGM